MTKKKIESGEVKEAEAKPVSRPLPQEYLVKRVFSNGEGVEYLDQNGIRKIIIRRPNVDLNTESGKLDYNFIHSMYKNMGIRVQLDNAELDSDEHINYVFNNPSTRIVLTMKKLGEFDYIGLAYLNRLPEQKELGYNHYYSIHGLIRSFKTDPFGNKIQTAEFYKKARKYNLIRKVIDEYFALNPDIITIDGWLPEYLKEKPIFGKDRIDNKVRQYRKVTGYRDLPAHKLLVGAGMKCPFHPMRNYGMKNGRPCDIFVYQIHRKFWRR